MLVEGQPMTLDVIRAFVGTPSAEQLASASLDETLQFVRYLVDPRKAEGKRLSFTSAAEGDRRIMRVELSNGVLVINDADSKAAVHVDVTRRALADCVLGKSLPFKGSDALAGLDGSLDRSHLRRAAASPPAVFEPKQNAKHSDGMEH